MTLYSAVAVLLWPEVGPEVLGDGVTLASTHTWTWFAFSIIKIQSVRQYGRCLQKMCLFERNQRPAATSLLEGI